MGFDEQLTVQRRVERIKIAVKPSARATKGPGGLGTWDIVTQSGPDWKMMSIARGFHEEM